MGTQPSTRLQLRRTQGTSAAMSADLAESKFTIPVDSENKAKSLNIFSINFPHHASFHMSWMGFFVSFVSTFAAAPMIAIIREDLELTKPNLGSAGLAAVTGTIGARVLMGSVCDVVGPRYGLSIVLLLSAPFCSACPTSPPPPDFSSAAWESVLAWPHSWLANSGCRACSTANVSV